MTVQDVLQKYRDELLPEFLDVPLEGVNSRGRFGDYPLHVAVIRGQMDEVKALLDGGADVNTPGDLGHLPLHYALRFGHEEITRVLLQMSSDVSLPNEFGETATELVQKYGSRELMELVLRQHGMLLL